MAVYTVFDKITELKKTYGQMLEATTKEWKLCSACPEKQDDIGNMLGLPLSVYAESANWQVDALQSCLLFMDEEPATDIMHRWCMSIARQVEAIIEAEEPIALYELSHLMHTIRGTINWLDTLEDHFKHAD